MKTIGIYIHIPFCKKKCSYCDFYSVADESLVEPYAKALTAHMREALTLLSGQAVDTVYIGGGTPALIGAKNLEGYLSLIRKGTALSPNAEVTVELNPESTDAKLVKKLRRAGVNRLSLGMQSACDEELQALGRLHSAGDVKRAVADIRAGGIENFSLDLMYGLPGGTRERFLDTLGEAIALKPKHISCYGLKLEEGTPLYERRDSLVLPDEDALADLYLETVDILGRAGYGQYEISNFAMPGYESRHNMKYWTLQEYIGFGAAAHSDFAGKRYSYLKDVAGYIDAIREGDAVTDSMEQIPMVERAAEYVMLGLRTAHGITGNDYTRLFRAGFEHIEKKLAYFESKGLARQVGGRWSLTPRGFLLSNRIIGALLDVSIEMGDKS